MAATTLLSDNGVSSGITGYQLTGGDDGTLQLQTTTAGGTATTAMTINASQNVGIGTSSPTGKLSVAVPDGSTTAFYAERTGASPAQLSVTFANQYANLLASGAMAFHTNGTQQAFIDTAGLFKFNSGYGSAATAYGCRAWVNFDGTGTVAIRASGNVSSITDNGTGDYTVNFSSAMPDANYAPEIAITKAGANTSSGGIAAASVSSAPTLMSTTQLRVVTGSDAYVCAVSILR